MITYTTIGSNYLPRAAVFHDALFGELGATGECPNGTRGLFYCSYVRDLDGNKLNFRCED